MDFFRRPFVDDPPHDFALVEVVGAGVGFEYLIAALGNLCPKVDQVGGHGSGGFRRVAGADFCGVIYQRAAFGVRPVLVLDTHPLNVWTQRFTGAISTKSALQCRTVLFRRNARSPVRKRLRGHGQPIRNYRESAMLLDCFM